MMYQLTTGFNWSTTYDFKVRAVNQLGFGVNSTILSIKTPVNPALCTLPTGMSTPTVGNVDPLNITISWTELTDSRNGGDIPIFYLVEWSSDNVTWTALNTGGPKVLKYSHILSSPFASGAFVYYRLRA